MNKIAIVFGKGLDGCGVEKYAAEFKRTLGNSVDIYSLAERSFSRGGGHLYDNAIKFKPKEIPDITKKLNDNYDIVIINSYPSCKHNRETVNSFFFDLILKIEKPILVAIMHEIKQMNYDRIPYHVAIANHSDIVYNFSTNTDYAIDISSILTNKKLGERIRRFKLPINIEDFAKYRLPFEEKAKRVVYTGRWTSMKDPSRLIDLKKISNSDLHFAIHGIERSIGAKSDIIDRTKYSMKFNGKYDFSSELVEAFGPYSYEEGMRIISDSMFGYSGFRLPKEPNNYGDRFEYSQMEVIAVGSVPIFDIHYGQHNYDESGNKFSDTDYLAVWSDKNNLPETIDKLTEISNSKKLYSLYQESGLDFLTREASADKIIPSMVEEILTLGKETNKVSFKSLLLNSFKEDIYEEFIKLSSLNIPAFGCKEVSEKTLSYFNKAARVVKRKTGIAKKKSLF